MLPPGIDGQNGGSGGDGAPGADGPEGLPGIDGQSSGSGYFSYPFSVKGVIVDLAEVDVHDIDVERGGVLTKVRARLKVAPVGGTVVITPYRNNSTALATVTIADGTKRKANDDYSVAFADGDSLSFAIDVQGTITTNPQTLALVCVFRAT